MQKKKISAAHFGDPLIKYREIYIYIYIERERERACKFKNPKQEKKYIIQQIINKWFIFLFEKQTNC